MLCISAHRALQKSKATAAFIIFGLILSFFFLWFSIGFQLRGRKPAVGWASVSGLFAGQRPAAYRDACVL